jgi:hypothetical protein
MQPPSTPSLRYGCNTLWDSRKKIPGTRDNWVGGYETDGKMHARNSFFTDFSMSSPLSTLKVPVSFLYTSFFSSHVKRSVFIHENCYSLLAFRNIFIFLVFNKIGKVYSVEYTDIPKVFFT